MNLFAKESWLENTLFPFLIASFCLQSAQSKYPKLKEKPNRLLLHFDEQSGFFSVAQLFDIEC